MSRTLLMMLEQFSQECSQLHLKQSAHHSEFGAQPMHERSGITHTDPESALQHFASISSANSLMLRTTILSQLCAQHSLLARSKSTPSDVGVTEPVAANSSEAGGVEAAPNSPARPTFNFDAEIESCGRILGDVSAFLKSIQRFVLPEMAMFVANRADSTQCMDDVLHELDAIEEVSDDEFLDSLYGTLDVCCNITSRLRCCRRRLGESRTNACLQGSKKPRTWV